MARHRDRLIAAVLLAVVIGAAISGTAPAESQNVQPMKDFVYPLEFHENGQVKIRLQAKTVAMTQEDKDRLDAQGVVLDIFDEEGHARGRLEAEDCVVDRKRSVVYSDDGLIRVERGGLMLTGRGFRFYMEAQRLEILNEVRVEITGAPEELDAIRPGPRTEAPSAVRLPRCPFGLNHPRHTVMG